MVVSNFVARTSCAGRIYSFFKYQKRQKRCSKPLPAKVQEKFYGFYGLNVQTRSSTKKKKQSNTIRYCIHRHKRLTKFSCAPADRLLRIISRGGVGLWLGQDGLATALHREWKERLQAEHRVATGREPFFVYNFPRTPLECLYSLECALGEAKVVRQRASSRKISPTPFFVFERPQPDLLECVLSVCAETLLRHLLQHQQPPLPVDRASDDPGRVPRQRRHDLFRLLE